MQEATQLLTRFLDSSGYEVLLAGCVWHSIGPVPPADCPHSAAAVCRAGLLSSPIEAGTGLHKKVTSQSFLMIRLLCSSPLWLLLQPNIRTLPNQKRLHYIGYKIRCVRGGSAARQRRRRTALRSAAARRTPLAS